MKYFYVYILASKKNGTLYTGVSNDISRRVFEHINKGSSFTSKYSVTNLVYFEAFESITLAIKREKQLKRWHRLWKLQLIEKFNPTWKNLYPEDAS